VADFSKFIAMDQRDAGAYYNRGLAYALEAQYDAEEEGRIPTQVTSEILGKVMAAMDYAHNMGVIHRDIKPANIGFTPEQVVKLMDFGIALNMAENDRLTRTGHILGTPHYMAPEQILGQPPMACTDIYALGITLYEMLAGKVPFEGDSDYAVSVAQINDPPPSLLSLSHDDITQEVEEVVFKALAKSPQERFHTAQEFRLALEAATSKLCRPELTSKDFLWSMTCCTTSSLKVTFSPEATTCFCLPSGSVRIKTPLAALVPSRTMFMTAWRKSLTLVLVTNNLLSCCRM
jgi:serine/threonine protein kinase